MQSDDVDAGAEEETDREEEDGDRSADDKDGIGPVVKPLTRGELEKFEAEQRKKGIIYISRVPHGMTVAKVRHLLSGFGDVERIYLQDGKEKERGEKLTGRASRSAHFTEGWVEFASKKVAKAVAEMLNAEPIGAASGGSGGGKGGKRAGGKNLRRWKDEVWTMKYLSGFKWGMLSEQLANERASRASRVRAELSQSTFEQKDYLKKVERARVMREKEARRQAREQKAQQPDTRQTPSSVQPAREHTFHQRETVSRDVGEQRSKRQRSNGDEGTRFKRPRPNAQANEMRSEALQGALTKIF